VLILNTINPSLSYINLFNDAPIPLISNGQYSNERDCSAYQTNSSTGERTCLAREGETCDISQSANFCGCGEVFVAIGTEPGYRCDKTGNEQNQNTGTTQDTGGNTTYDVNPGSSQSYSVQDTNTGIDQAQWELSCVENGGTYNTNTEMSGGGYDAIITLNCD